MTNKKAQYFVREYIDRPVTKKEFLRLRDEEVKKIYVSRQHLLIENKKFTRYQLDTYEKEGLLKPIKHRGKKFFSKAEIMSIINSEPIQGKMLL